MLKVAVCDDDEKAINSIRFILRYFVNENLEVDIFRKGRDLLEKVEDEDYNLILLDIDMSDISGFDVARKVFRMKYGDNLILFMKL